MIKTARPSGSSLAQACYSWLLAFALAATTSICGDAFAQELDAGDAVVTRFSGVVETPEGPAIDPDGPSAIGLSLAMPGASPGGRTTEPFPELFKVKAEDVGQVFGVAIRPGEPATIYFTATSAFGLHREDGDWMPGQWGAEGGPGTVYRLVAEEGARPEILATITLNGRENTGAALGNIAYDRRNNQLFVSDLETGMIHRLDANDGRALGRYDHGVEGRPAFTDLERMEVGSRPEVAFDPATQAQISDCAEGDFDETPACWNIADFRRRVWGLDVFYDESLGAMRLYYAVWSSQGFGNPEWSDAPQEQINTVWSVGIDATGAFDTSDVRLEFDLPGFFTTPEDYERAGGSHPVTDITISALGEMLAAERGGLASLGLNAAAPFARPHEARVLKFRRDENRIWTPVGRYDVGFYDRTEEGRPFLRANAAGGVAIGFGYDDAGQLDLDREDRFVWLTGDDLCMPEGPCFAVDGTQTITGPVNGVHGQPIDVAGEVNPAAAFDDYPETGPATPTSGPEQAYMRDIVDSHEDDAPEARATWVGDVAIAGISAEPAPLAEGEPDLAISKEMPPFCFAGGLCTTRITVTNVGNTSWSGPIFLDDVASPAGASFAAISAPGVCTEIDGTIACYRAHTSLAPNESRELVLDLSVPGGMAGATLENCATIVWPLATPGNSASVTRAVQRALTILGYDPGPIDGAFGSLTAAAIGELQAELGIEQTFAIDAGLLDILFAGDASLPGDGNPGNHRACATTEIIPGEPPPAGVHVPFGSFGGHAFPASIHSPIGSGPAHAFPGSVHLPAGSGPWHPFPWSVHLPVGSVPAHVFPWSVHLPIGSAPGHAFPASVHLPVGSAGGHAFPASVHLPIGSAPAHVFPWSVHLPIGSFGGHAFPASVHLPIGSGGGHAFPASVHLPLGSGGGHAFPASVHLPIGSGPGHLFPFSVHLPIGSGGGHFFPASVHLPIGSGGGHFFPASVHLPIGSAPQHLPLGSIHLPLGSGLHLPFGSAGGFHAPAISAIGPHHPVLSAAGPHAPLASGGGIHLPVGSFGGVHLPLGSGVWPLTQGQAHDPAISGLHLPIGSAGGPHVPPGSAGGIHLPVGSNGAAAPEAEEPPEAQEPVHLPVGSAPVHRPQGSVQTHQPAGSEPPQVHRPRGSVQTHQPAGSEPQVHRPRGSVQTHQPTGSEPQVHLPRGSTPQLHLPIGSQPQTHQPPGSEPQVHLPRGSAPQLHLPLGSGQQTQEPLDTPRTHLPRLSRQQQSGDDVQIVPQVTPRLFTPPQ